MTLIDSLLSVLFPPLCLSCDTLLEKQDRKLCDECASLLEFIDPADRCPRCFSSITTKSCPNCFRTMHPFSGTASAFDFCGPPAALVQKMKGCGQSYLAKVLAACLMTQLGRLNWPMPDLIVPVPLSWERHLKRGFNQSFLIGQELSDMVGIPLENILSRAFGEFSQSSLGHKQRQRQNPRFFLKKGSFIEDKTILLVDDVIVTGQTLQRCAKALVEGFPRKIYGLTICKTEIN